MTVTDAAAMPITALAPWFGAKRTLAARIVEEFGPHRAYWELMCGAMSVLLAKPPCAMETVNDLHGDLVNLARVVQDPVYGPRLYRLLRRTLMHETFFAEAEAMYADLAAQFCANGAPDEGLDPRPEVGA